MKKILITNDDGIFAEGIQTLANSFHDAGYEVLAVAPDRERSASGHSMTMDRPLHIKKIENKMLANGFTAYSCDGTPTDCVIMGIDVLHFVPDLVLSGINCGPNLGDDLTYSPEKYFATAAEAALQTARWIAGHPMADDVMYNVNVPNEKPGDIAGVRVTRKGKRRYHDKITVVKTPFGGEAYWVGGSIHDEMHEDTDVWAVAHNYVSITPVHLEMTSFDTYYAAKKTPMEAEIHKSMKTK